MIGASGFMPSSASVTAGSASYSTLTSSQALRASSGESAATLKSGDRVTVFPMIAGG